MATLLCVVVTLCVQDVAPLATSPAGIANGMQQQQQAAGVNGPARQQQLSPAAVAELAAKSYCVMADFAATVCGSQPWAKLLESCKHQVRISAQCGTQSTGVRD